MAYCFGLNIFYSEEKDWVQHTMRRPLQNLLLLIALNNRPTIVYTKVNMRTVVSLQVFTTQKREFIDPSHHMHNFDRSIQHCRSIVTFLE